MSLRLGPLKLHGTAHEHDIETVTGQYYALTLMYDVCDCMFSCSFQSKLCADLHSVVSFPGVVR